MSATSALLIFLEAVFLVCVSGLVLDPDYGASTQQLIKSRGFRYEEHNIVTKDGYILKTFRIKNPKFRTSVALLPVLLVPGFLSSTRDFLVATSDGHVDEGTSIVGGNMGFELAKRDYDVWLLNCRGNVYSQNHTKYATNEKVNPDPRFWDFSHEDMAQYDIPAAVNYILKRTGRRTLAYIGHSRGTTVAFAALTIYPDLNRKIRPLIALSPITTIKFASGIGTARSVQAFATLTGEYNFPFLQKSPVPESVMRATCMIRNGIICAKGIESLFGDKPDCWRGSRLPVILSGFPAGSSVKDGRLFVTDLMTGKFSRYDYGTIKNWEVYGTLNAPEFELQKITNQEIYLIKGPADLLSDPLDTNRLRLTLGSRIRKTIVIKKPCFGHGAILFGRETAEYVVTPVLEILDNYE